MGAIRAAERKHFSRVLILEKSGKLLSKVRISGGGRCNVTHACFSPARLAQHYPRGQKFLAPVFKAHGAGETVEWFKSKGVHLKTEGDGRMFPTTDDSSTIVDCLLREARQHGIEIRMGEAVQKIVPKNDTLQIITQNGSALLGRRVLVAIGGNPNSGAYNFIRELGHKICGPIPSLFTFNDPARQFSDLMGISVPEAEVRIAGSKFKQKGPLLITHWGLSGPAVIRLSSWAAEYLHEINYQFTVLISWIGPYEEEKLRAYLGQQKTLRMKQKVVGHPLFGLPQRLWVKLCALADIPDDKVWAEMGQKNLNKLLESLHKCKVEIRGKTTFKEEFVTCGGVDLKEVEKSTMESRLVKGIHFAGEVLDIDGETGGFNFQAAWSTAYLAAKAVAEGI